MKKKLVILVCLVVLFACKKSSGSHGGAVYANFDYSATFAPGTVAGIIANRPIVQCIYHPDSPQLGYLFQFIDTTLAPRWTGIQFPITGDSLGNIAAKGSYNNSYSTTSDYQLSLECIFYQADADTSVAGVDSASIQVYISRLSGGSMDGTFSGGIWGQNNYSVTFTNGYFYDVPIINK